MIDDGFYGKQVIIDQNVKYIGDGEDPDGSETLMIALESTNAIKLQTEWPPVDFGD